MRTEALFGVVAWCWVAGNPAHAQDQSIGSIIRDCPDCPELVLVPAGTFIMGSTSEETAKAALPAEQAAREYPAHRVTIPRPFAIGRYEVTVGEYEAFVNATHHVSSANCTTWDSAKGIWGPVPEADWRNPGYVQSTRHPVGCLTITDARAYTQWLSSRTGKAYRVPSEAEWEYVARAGATTLHTWGDTNKDICAYANVADQTRVEAHKIADPDPTRFFPCRDGHVFASPVGSFPANPWGLYDVIGNIWEWTEDCFIPHYDGAPTDGSVRREEGCDRLIVRGGGWYSRTWFARAPGRSREEPSYRSSTLGLRVVRDLN
ncbi:MAG: formylglycine-generating enzyme family protein [Rhodospirillaceae bacterium]|nr:formylglycine-generating enzyme family protein [Rhodospirillaceae bacterium]